MQEQVAQIVKLSSTTTGIYGDFWLSELVLKSYFTIIPFKKSPRFRLSNDQGTTGLVKGEQTPISFLSHFQQPNI